MADITYEYLLKQKRFLKNCDKVPYNGYIGGFGSGKTHVLTLQALREGARPSRGLIGAPTYKMLEDTTQQKFFDLCPPSWLRSFMKQRNKVQLVNGTEILFRSLDRPGRLAGLELDWFGLDEIGEVKEDTFKMLMGRLRKPGGSHHGFGVGNPAGPVHWTHAYFVDKTREFPDKFKLVQATSYENTFLPGQYAEDMAIAFGKDTVYYRRYVLGEFAAFEGAYWSNFDLRPYPAGHVIEPTSVLSMLQGTPRWGRVVDFGFEHPFACLWWVTDDQVIIFFDEYHQKHGLIKWHCLQIKEHEKRHHQLYGPHRYGISYTDHEAVSRAEVAHAEVEGKAIGFECVPVEKRVMESILLVQTLFGQRKLFITSNCKRTLLEIPSYRAKSGVVGEEPLREEEDTCCCVRYACWMEMNHAMGFRRFGETKSVVPDDILELAGAQLKW